MVVRRRNFLAVDGSVGDYDAVAIGSVPSRKGDLAAASRLHRVVHLGTEIDSGVELVLMRHRVFALTVRRSHWRVTIDGHRHLLARWNIGSAACGLLVLRGEGLDTGDIGARLVVWGDAPVLFHRPPPGVVR